MAVGIRWTWRGDEPRSEADPSQLPAAIEELAEILDGLPWVLGGGLAIPFTRGSFHRPHADVDVLFEDRHFPEIAAAFAHRGFELWQHYTMSLFGAFGGRLHIRVHPSHPLARIRRRRLKFRDLSGRRAASDLLVAVDALPFRLVDGMLCTCDGRHRFALTRPVVGYRAQTAAGYEVPCLDFEYVARLKGPRRDPKDLQDFTIIRDRGLLPEGDWGV